MTPRCSTWYVKQHRSSSSRNSHKENRRSKNHRQGLPFMSRYYYTIKKIFEPSASIWGRIPPNPLIAKVVYKKGTPRGSSSNSKEHCSGPKHKHQQASHCRKNHRQGHNQFVRYYTNHRHIQTSCLNR